MRLVVQIPCLNEEQTLSLVLNSIPKTIPGISHIDILVVDDGSSDDTVGTAKKHGVKHFVIHSHNMGLARSFHDGIMKALEMGADIVVNTDGDNQYPSHKISQLVQPILNGEAEIVVADRQTQKIAHFSFSKKLLQRFGSWVVNQAAGTTLPDAASGFRAYSKESLLRLNIITTFSYCMETIIQAGNKRLAITSIQIETNSKTRESRLFSSTFQHVSQSAKAIIRSYMMYKPYVLFASAALVLFLLGLIPFVRYLYLEWIINDGGSHIQSLLVGVAFMIASFISLALAVISDNIKTNRILIEEQIEQIKRMRFK